jgi:hypothetical protein
MAPELFKLIESDQLAAEFYLISDTGSLVRWITRLPAVAALEDLASSDSASAELLESRTMELFRAPVVSGYRTEFESAICCYAYVLSRLARESARRILNVLDANASPTYGWLRRLLDRCLENSSTTESLTEVYLPPSSRVVSIGATTPITVVQTELSAINDTSFDSLMEFWSSEDYRDLKAA